MSRDLELLDEQVETFARHRGIELDEPMRTLLRDAMLWAHDDAAACALATAAPDGDDDRRWTKEQRAAFTALTGFCDVTRAWIDRVRVEVDLPERQHKTLEDRIRARLGSGRS